MKHLLIIGLTGLILCSSCKKKEEKPDEVVVTENGATASANLDGSGWNSTTASSTVNNGDVSVILDSDKKRITFTLTEEGAGFYALPSSVANATLVDKENGNTTYAITGNLVLSSFNASAKKVNGSFSGVAANGGTNIIISNGTFGNVPFTGAYTGAGVNTLQEGSASVNGLEMNPNLITGNIGFGQIALNIAANNGAETIGINVPTGIVNGEYNLSSSGDYRGTYSNSGDASGQYAASAGTLTIISHNTQEKNIKGTFSFTAAPTPGNSSTTNIEISAGAFAINY